MLLIVILVKVKQHQKIKSDFISYVKNLTLDWLSYIQM